MVPTGIFIFSQIPNGTKMVRRDEDDSGIQGSLYRGILGAIWPTSSYLKNSFAESFNELGFDMRQCKEVPL